MIEKECIYCNKTFHAKRISTQLCSSYCRNNNAIQERNKRCKDCNTLIKGYKSIYCPVCCRKHIVHYWGEKISKSKTGKPNPFGTFKKGHKHSSESIEKMRISHTGKSGARRTEEWKRKISESNKGKKLSEGSIIKMKETKARLLKEGKLVVWNKGVKGLRTWNKGLKGVQVAWNKNKKNEKISGDKHHNWKGGITPEYHKIRNSIEYKNWRRSVFERDRYTCTNCKKSKEVSGRLEADHIKPFSLHPELRLCIDNGRTLCETCHDKIGWRPRKKQVVS